MLLCGCSVTRVIAPSFSDTTIIFLQHFFQTVSYGYRSTCYVRSILWSQAPSTLPSPWGRPVTRTFADVCTLGLQHARRPIQPVSTWSSAEVFTHQFRPRFASSAIFSSNAISNVLRLPLVGQQSGQFLVEFLQNRGGARFDESYVFTLRAVTVQLCNICICFQLMHCLGSAYSF